MKKNRIRCFVSYNHSDADRDTLNILRDWLVINGNDAIEVLFDEDLDYGDDFDKFMELLLDVECVFLIFTPGYKQKIKERKKGGVFNEYKIIMSRYLEIEELKHEEGSVEGLTNCIFMPVLFSGDRSSSVPEEFSTIKHLDFRNFRARKDSRSGKYIVSKQDERRYKKEVAKVVNRIIAAHALNTVEYKRHYNEIYTLLFERLKADWVPSLSEEEMEVQNHLFVKTLAYKKVDRQNSYLLVGRKGSGKSTVTQFLANRNKERYKKSIPVIVDDFELDYIFGMFDIPSFESDTKHIITVSKAFSFSWEVFIYICCMEILIEEYNNNKVTKSQGKYIKHIIKHFESVKGSAENSGKIWRKSASFSYCLFKLKAFISDVIENSREEPEYFYADILNAFTLENFNKFVFTGSVVSSFNQAVKECRRKFLISLDGFDTAFDKYRSTTIQKYPYDRDLQSTRITHEVEWLASLLHVVLRMKSNHENSTLYANTDFCITIPKDRFIEVRRLERDSYIYERKYANLNWTGLELAILLRKRLELLGDYYTEKQLPVEDRLDDVLYESFSCIPQETETLVSGNTYKMHIFLDVLRHTFWRPRDVLYYFSTIIAVSQNLKKRNKKITNSVIRKLISETTYKVIKHEFISEFESSLTNLDEILRKFYLKKQLLTISELKTTLENTHFDFAYSVEKETTIEEKIRYLYEIGFLGVNASQEMATRFSLTMKHAFYFNEGDSIIEADGNDPYGGYEFIIHPIFCEYLRLDTSNQEIVLLFSWDYLHEGEAYFI